MKVYSGTVESHLGAVKTPIGVVKVLNVESHPGARDALTRAQEAHPGVVEALLGL